MKRIIGILALLVIAMSMCSCSLFDKTPPVIKLSTTEETMFVGEKLPNFMRYATASDDKDGDLSQAISADTSKVDPSKVGKYKVVFSVADKAGNESTANFFINVISHNRWDPVVENGYYTIPFDLDEFVTAWNDENPDALFTYDARNEYSIDGRNINSTNTITAAYIVPTINWDSTNPFGVTITITPMLVSYGMNAFASWRIDYETLQYWAKNEYMNSKIDGSNEDKMVTTQVMFACEDLFKVMFPYDDSHKIWKEFIAWVANDNTSTDRVAASFIKSTSDDNRCFSYGGYEFSMTNGGNFIAIFCRAAS